jgi:hypothetical protein
LTAPPPDGRTEPHSARFLLLALLLGTVLAAFGLEQVSRASNEDFEAAALGAGTISHFAHEDGAPIHCRDLRDADQCLAAHARRGAPPVALWLGNSQLHAVNDYRDGDETVAPILRRSLAADGLDVLTFSQPNANLQEHLVLYAWLAGRLPIRALVLPLVFDDGRETGIRSTLAGALEDAEVKRLLAGSEAGARILAGSRPRAARGGFAALEGTLQQPVEAALDGWLDAKVQAWAERSRTRGELFLGLYRLRNAALGIESQTIRRAIPGRLRLNLAAADALLRDTRARGIATVVYTAPLRGDVKPRHVPSEYAAFRRDAQALAALHGARFADLHGAIPVEAWGSGLDEEGAALDVQHFGREGHALLARSVEQLVRDALADAP